MREISVEDFAKNQRYRPAICVGTSATSPQFDSDSILNNLIEEYASQVFNAEEHSDSSTQELLDLIRNSSSATFEKIYSGFKQKVLSIPTHMNVERISQFGWSACISLSIDHTFEKSLRDHVDHKPSSLTVTTISCPGISVPERTIPVYKLLGELHYINDDSALAIAESDLLQRMYKWPILLKSFPDFVKGGNVVLYGLSNQNRSLRTLLTILSEMPKPRITDLVILQDDVSWIDPSVKAILSKFSVNKVNGTISDIITAFEDNHPTKVRRSKLRKLSNFNLESLNDEFSDLFVAVVPESQNSEDLNKLRPELTDSLFRPTSTDFRPFWFEMDLRRNISFDLLDLTLSQCSDPTTLDPVVILGEAGVGKTTVLKRLAVDLVEKGFLVYWCKKAQIHRWPQRLREFVEETNKIQGLLVKKYKGVIVFCDDPVSLRINSSELASVISKLNIENQIVISVRKSEFYIRDTEFEFNLSKGNSVVELPYLLEDNEIQKLPDLLVKIGAARNSAESSLIVSRRGGDDADDILCSLWYLVPETREHIVDSLGNEFLRLGGQYESIKGLAKVADSSHVAKNAYQIVSVISNLGLGIPMEVLVHSIQIDYTDWTDVISHNGSLWGLIYEEDHENGETVLYRTRNSVVTNILVGLVNGGVGRAGEAKILRTIVDSCSSSPTYRNFLVDVLVGKRRELESMLSFEQGDELFELALVNVGVPDKILEHHHGVWKYHKGDDLQLAYKKLEKALDCPNYPNSSLGKNAHIKTSQAAVIVQMVKSGEQDPETGLTLVREHLREISQTGISDPHSSHVHANMLFDLSERGEINPELASQSLSQALSEIQGALQRVGSVKQQKSTGGVEALLSLRRRILESITDPDKVKEIADEMFESNKSQDGFHLYFQIIFSRAATSGKGSEYNTAYKYIDSKIKNCIEKGIEVMPELLKDRAELIIRWQVHGMKTQIMWDSLHQDLQSILALPSYSEDLLLKFYFAVACYHLHERVEANARFAEIRRLNPDQSAMPWLIRCAYLGKEGSPKRFQGTVSGSGSNMYVKINELEDTVRVPKSYSIGAIGATVHVYIGFSLRGPLVLKVKPEHGYYELP